MSYCCISLKFHVSDRPGLRCIDQVEKIQNKLTESLQNMINLTHKEDNTLFAKLLMKTTDLRTLNALHSEKTVGKKWTLLYVDFLLFFVYPSMLTTRPRSAVGNMSDCRYVSDYRSRGCKFDPSVPSLLLIQEGLLSVTSESMCTKYHLVKHAQEKKCG